MKFTISFILLCLSIHVHAQYVNPSMIDSLKQKVLILEKPQEKMETLQELAFKYSSIDLDSSAFYTNQALELCKKYNDDHCFTKVDFQLGLNHLKRGKLNLAKKHLQKSIEGEIEFKEDDHEGKVALCYYYLGIIEHQLGDFEKSIHHYNEGIKYTRISKNVRVKEVVLNIAIAMIYSELKYFKKSKEYYESALAIGTEKNDTVILANVHYNLGADYLDQKDLISAESHALMAFKCYNHIQNPAGIAATQYQIGMIKGKQKDFVSAFDYLNQSINNAQKFGDSYSAIVAESAILKFKVEQNENQSNKIAQLEPAFASLIQKSKDLGVPDLLMNNKEAYSDVLFAAGKYKKAFQEKNDFVMMKDTLIGQNVQEEIAALNEKYYKAVSENEIALLSSKNEITAIKLSNSRKQSGILGGSLLLITGLLFFLWNTFKKVKIQNLTIKKNSEEKDLLLREIHHRVKNNLQVISSLLLLQSKYITDDSVLNALQQGHNRVQSMALIHQDLYQTDNLKGVNAEKYFTKLVQNLFDSYNISEDRIKLSIDVDPIMLDVDTMIPLGLVMNELVSNSLKHAFAKDKDGLINVKLEQGDDTLILNVSDNGKGVMNMEEIEGKSFGFELIKAFAQKLDAKIEIKNEKGFDIFLLIKNYNLAA